MSIGRLPVGHALGVPVAQLVDHGDRGAHGAVLVVLMRQGQAEYRHDRVADELVEHAALLAECTPPSG